MGASAAYPKLLGWKIVEAWNNWRRLQESSKSTTSVQESTTGVQESSGSDSDSNSSSGAWDGVVTPVLDAMDEAKFAPPNRKRQFRRLPRSSSSSCAWSGDDNSGAWSE